VKDRDQLPRPIWRDSREVKPRDFRAVKFVGSILFFVAANAILYFVLKRRVLPKTAIIYTVCAGFPIFFVLLRAFVYNKFPTRWGETDLD
jgi:hypothetical protein